MYGNYSCELRESVKVKLAYRPKTAVSESELTKYKAFALELAELGGAAALPYFRNKYEVENKLGEADFDPVTIADKSAELSMRKAIEFRYPSHAIYGEEHGLTPGSDLTWVLDPIDGTRAFITGMLHWGVLVALFDGEEPIIGVMHQPFTNEFFVGDNYSAEYIKGVQHRTLQVRSCGSIREAVLASTGPQFFSKEEELGAFLELEQSVRLLRYGGDCYIYCMLAMGQLDLVAEAGLSPYDIQALIPIIRGAGGHIATWDDKNPSMGGRILAAGDKQVFSQAMQTLGFSEK
ncbi:MAG: inositol monophosphatase family protein [Pseudomonadales bacterium]|nr:inositol monophosphatase family protein [Pseudomonadales bacterium]